MQTQEYDREKAVAYAHEWAFSRNPGYYDFSSIGGDCTNFVSQCVYAGAGQMNFAHTFGWYYTNTNDRTPSWTGVEYFFRFMVRKSESPGPFMEQSALEAMRPGDIIQIQFADKTEFTHMPLVVATGRTPRPENILVAAHTLDSDNRPLATYEYVALRPLRVLGVRV